MESSEPGRFGWIGLKRASLSFGHIAALKTVDFGIVSGEVHALVGNHNDGKSVLCRLLAGIDAPDSGSVTVDGIPLRRYRISDASSLGVEYLSDAAELFPHLSILENMTIGTFARSGRFFKPGSEKGKLTRWLADFGLECGVESIASRFSAEDRLLIKILGSLYKNPRLLIMDETLEQFPPGRRLLLMNELRRRCDAGMAVLWATHKLDEALEWADRVTILRNGRRYLTADADKLDRRSLIRMTYSSIEAHSADSEDDLENYYNLVRYSEVLLEHLPSAVFVMDPEEKIRFANASGLRLLSIESSYRPGMSVLEALGEGNARVVDMVRNTLKSMEATEAGAVAFAVPGGEILVDARVMAARDATGRLSLMLILDDVSDREAMRRQLAVAHNLSSIGMLAAGVAHEVNNPLESIGNYVSYLQRRVVDGDHMDVLARIQNEAGCIRDIVTNLVTFSGKGERKGLDVNVVRAIRDMVDMLGYNPQYDDIEIDFTHPDDPVVVDMDPNEFRQILLNLIRNSREAMPGGGAILVDVAVADNSRARIVLRDYGDGIDPCLLVDNEAFLPFVSGKKGDAGNQGLGLSIVFGLVKKWGGDITVGTATPGTRFILEFPLKNAALTPG